MGLPQERSHTTQWDGDCLRLPAACGRFCRRTAATYAAMPAVRADNAVAECWYRGGAYAYANRRLRRVRKCARPSHRGRPLYDQLSFEASGARNEHLTPVWIAERVPGRGIHSSLGCERVIRQCRAACEGATRSGTAKPARVLSLESVPVGRGTHSCLGLSDRRELVYLRIGFCRSLEGSNF